MYVKQIDSMILNPHEKNQVEVWSKEEDMLSLVWYVQQLVHNAYRVGLEQNMAEDKSE